MEGPPEQALSVLSGAVVLAVPTVSVVPVVARSVSVEAAVAVSPDDDVPATASAVLDAVSESVSATVSSSVPVSADASTSARRA